MIRSIIQICIVAHKSDTADLWLHLPLSRVHTGLLAWTRDRSLRDFIHITVNRSSNFVDSTGSKIRVLISHPSENIPIFSVFVSEL